MLYSLKHSYPSCLQVISKHNCKLTATIRRLIVEVVDVRNLLPKDGHGSSSPYVVIDYYGQRKKTHTAIRDLNPTWNDVLAFNVGKPSVVFTDMLELDVFHDQNYGPTRRNNFLGRIQLSSTQFVRKGEEALIYYPLENRNLFIWIQGEIGLKIFYVDEVPMPPTPSQPPPSDPPVEQARTDPQVEQSAEAPANTEAKAAPAPADAGSADQAPPPAEEPAVAEAPKDDTAEENVPAGEAEKEQEGRHVSSCSSTTAGGGTTTSSARRSGTAHARTETR